MKNDKREKITTKIERLGVHGEGVGSLDGLTLFIDGALPGEVVEARMIERKKRFARAELESIVTPSPSRITPPCPVADKCGGCQIMSLDSSAQREIKRQLVVDALERIGKFSNINVEPCVPSPTPLAYRNKIQVSVIPNISSNSNNSGLRLGFYARNSHDLIDIADCKIHSHLGDQVFQKVSDLLKNSNITAYHRQTFQGELRHLIIRTALHTNEALVIFVTNGRGSDSLKKLAHTICDTIPEVKGVIQNINTIPNNVVLGKEYHTLSGQGYIEEILCGLRFKISPASFFQVNPRQAEQLYRAAIALAGLTGTETVLDAYCGVGTQTLLMAQKAKWAIGIECVPEAIEDAKHNGQLNGITNTTFICAEVEKWIMSQNGKQRIDVALINPPRKGCEPSFIEKIGYLKPRTLVYVSCDPATLARDLALLKTHGYQIETVQPFDMFPQTAHVETIVKLQLK